MFKLKKTHILYYRDITFYTIYSYYKSTVVYGYSFIDKLDHILLRLYDYKT